MNNKISAYNFITFLTCLTIFFSINFTLPVSAEPQTETTTEAPSVINNYAEPSKQLEIGSRACILVDAETGVVLYEKNSRERLYPASITKILTGYIACEEGNFDDTLTVSQNAVDTMGEGGSNIGLVPGEEISFEDGIYAVMLESANEVCGAIAEHLSGSIPAFVEKMNAKVKELGCTDTHFANPHGFHDPNHYTNCYDMSLITRAAIKNPDFDQIWGTVSHNIPATNKNVERYLHHKDKMLRPTSDYYYEYAVGGKTGFHDDAGHTLVTYAEKDGIGLITVVMKDDSGKYTYSDTKTLMDYGFTLYHDAELFNADSYHKNVPVVQEYNGNEYNVGAVDLSAANSITAKVPNFITQDKITIKPDIAEKLNPPIEAGTAVGKINAYYNDNLLGSVDILPLGSVEALTEKQLSFMELKTNARRFIIFSGKLFIVVFALVILVLLIDFIRKLFRPKKKKRKKKKKKKRKNPNRPSGSSNPPKKKRPANGTGPQKKKSSSGNTAEHKRKSSSGNTAEHKRKSSSGNNDKPKKKRPAPGQYPEGRREPQNTDELHRRTKSKTNATRTYNDDIYGVPMRRRSQHRK